MWCPVPCLVCCYAAGHGTRAAASQCWQAARLAARAPNSQCRNVSPGLPPSLPVVRSLPALQHLVLAHNRLSGCLSCELVAGPLAELEVAGKRLAFAPSCVQPAGRGAAAEEG